MKRTNWARASVLALALGTAGAGTALADTLIGTAPGTTEADCLKSGGTVATDAQGRKVCKPPHPTRIQGTPNGREPPN
ncbi:MAG TPA: hypothetical protein VMU08_14655 [Rhizomicrobium sp.]|nr:hypothetical protein [Rhizomicrobium sp.]